MQFLFSVQASRSLAVQAVYVCSCVKVLCALIPLSGPLERGVKGIADRQRMKQEGCSPPRQSEKTDQARVGSDREGSILRILQTNSVCRSFAPHVEGQGTIYLGNGGKGLSSVAVGETAGIFSDVVLAAKDCGTVRRPTTRRRQRQAMTA